MIPNMTRMCLSPFCTHIPTIPTNFTFYSVEVFSFGLSWWRIDRCQSGSIRSPCGSLRSAPVSKTQLIGCLRQVVKRNLMTSLYFFFVNWVKLLVLSSLQTFAYRFLDGFQLSTRCRKKRTRNMLPSRKCFLEASMK